MDVNNYINILSKQGNSITALLTIMALVYFLDRIFKFIKFFKPNIVSQIKPANSHCSGLLAPILESLNKNLEKMTDQQNSVNETLHIMEKTTDRSHDKLGRIENHMGCIITDFSNLTRTQDNIFKRINDLRTGT